MKTLLTLMVWLCLLWHSAAVNAAQHFVVPIQSDMAQSRLTELVKVYNRKQLAHADLFDGGHASTEGLRYLNELILQNSPYLLRHATNPIDWKPWSAQVFAQAKAQNKLVFLSIGYSTCHWCHVMEQDSFVKEDIAQLLNRDFIAVKVDRESHPAIDELYTSALTQVTGSSGWPVTAVLNEKGEPVFINAFLAHEKLKVLLTRLNALWQNNSEYLNQNAANVMALVRQQHSSTEQPKWDPQVLTTTVQKVVAQLDTVEGGFVGKPKFPSEGMLLFLMDQLTRQDNQQMSELVQLQLDKMSAKGLYDSIHGGFHRYSTDSQWVVPHYEKMLYNQGQLLMVYAQAAKLYGKTHYRSIIKDTVSFIRAWLHQPGGGLYSAMDADYKGEDGGFYLRTEVQLEQINEKLRSESGMQTYPFESSGQHGIYFTHPDAEASQTIRRLLAAQTVDKPHIDKKIIAAWNALVIWGLVDAYEVVADEQFRQLAIDLAQTLWSSHYSEQNQQLYRSVFDQAIGEPGTLEDYAFFAKALLRLYDVSADKRWLKKAQLLGKAAIARFKDDNQGFLLSNRQSDNALAVNVTKTKDAEILPAGAVMVEVIRHLFRATGDVFYKQQLKAVAGHLKGRLSADPLNHLYAARVINNIQNKNTEQQQYFAGGRGKVVLTGEQAGQSVCSGMAEVKLKLSLASGWHVNSATPLQDYLRPTKVTFNSKDSDSRVWYPKGKEVRLGFQKQPLDVYEQAFELRVKPGHSGNETIRFKLDVQACSDSVCLLPEKLLFYLPRCDV